MGGSNERAARDPEIYSKERMLGVPFNAARATAGPYRGILFQKLLYAGTHAKNAEGSGLGGSHKPCTLNPET